MTTDCTYKIIISISHHRIAYEYWQRDGENKIAPMPVGKWPAPLAFFCSSNGIVMGEDAERAVRQGTKNAFEGYFDRLADNVTYTLGDQTKPLRNILLDASEAIFRDFFHNVLYDRIGALSDNRAHMPLTIVCESDVTSPEQALLIGMFKDSGYARVRLVKYEKYIEQYVKKTLAERYDCDKVVVAWAEGPDLTFTLFDAIGRSEPVSMTCPGLGIDPRKDYVKNQLWTRIKNYNGFLRREDEEDAIDRAATNFLNSQLPMINSSLLLSDGSTLYYSLNKTYIDNFLSDEGASIKNALRAFLQQNGIENRARVVMLLRGVAADNSYFEQNLNQGFSETIKTNRSLRESAMKLIIADDSTDDDGITGITVTPPTPPGGDKALKKEWRQLKASANGKARSGNADAALQMLRDFYSKCSACPDTENLLTEINAEIKRLDMSGNTPTQTGPDQPIDPPINLAEVTRMKRKWIDIRRFAIYKERNKAANEALSILLSFVDEVSKVPGAEDILKSANDLIANLNGMPSNEEPVRKPTRTTVVQTPAPTAEDPGKELIRKGLIKEARDWYRNQSNTQMAKLLTDIIRAEKSLERRKTDLDTCRKSKNKEQIKRIIDELLGYIDLCEKAGVNAAEYKTLLVDYKKI